MPPLQPVSRDQNIFTPDQAAILGDLVMQQVARDFKIVRDPAVADYLRRIGDRMAAIAGLGSLQIDLVDFPEANAVTLPGGRILVGRKIVSFARSEDEVAGVLAHEIGHVVNRDGERDFSTVLRVVLNVTALGDRQDIEEKYNRVLDNQSRNADRIRSARRGDSERQQENADQIAIWLMARAGYAPQAYVDIFDRITELDSKTGSWLSDLFGTTKPESRRLRVALKAAAALPAACVAAPQPAAPFVEWQQKVVEAARGAGTVSLHGIISQHRLEPPLRSDLAHLRFSPDGKWVMAQDDSSVYVFTRAPLSFVFRIDAPDAFPAQFTPDSGAVVFNDDNYRVEKWALATARREWVRELVPTKQCVDGVLSPDAALFACVTSELSLRLHDVSTGAVVFEKKNWYTATLLDSLLLLFLGTYNPDRSPFFQMHFSPDVRYFVAARGDSSVAVDLTKRAAMSLPGSIRDRLGTSFSFLGNDRVVGVHGDNPQQSAIVTFPQGQVTATLKLGAQTVTAPTRGDSYVLLHGFPGYQVAVFDVKQNRAVLGTPLPGLDLYDDSMLSERKDGELGLYTVTTRTAASVASVPTGPLGRLRAADVSPDLGLLAISERSRGGLWDVTDGRRRILVKGFRGVQIDPRRVAYIDVPGAPRAIVRLDDTAHSATPLVGIQPPPPPNAKQTAPPRPVGPTLLATVTASGVTQYGALLLGWQNLVTDPFTDSTSGTMVVYEAATGRKLWSRPFPKETPAAVRSEARHNTLVFAWNYTSDGARDIVNANPALKSQFESLHAKREDVGLNEVVDLATGKPRGYLLIDFANGSFSLRSAVAVGDLVVFNDNRNRTIVYSLASGAQVGHAFGTSLDVSKDGALVAVQNASGELTVHALPRLGRVDGWQFPSEVAFARFSDDGRKLFVLTVDHTVYTVTVSARS